jgi:hypothetical protein
MYYINKLAKITVFILIFTLMFGTVVSAEESTAPSAGETASAQLKMRFPDVSSGHWAQKHVAKLALQGIILGDTNGKYNPNGYVTKEEALIMAVKLMGLEKQAEAKNTDDVLPYYLQVSSWAKKYVLTAVDHELISFNEEQAEGEASGKIWGKQFATREWAAKIVIRAIGKEAEAAQKIGPASSFLDFAEMSDAYKGFVNAAVKLKIVSGFQDNTFKPKGFVNRAQMAVFLSLGEQYLKNRNEKVVIGHVLELSGSTITIVDKQNETKQFRLRNDAPLYSVKDNLKILQPNEIKNYFEIYLIQDEGSVYFVEVLDDVVAMETIEGKLVDIKVSSMSLTLTAGGETRTFELTPTVSVIDKEGMGASLSSLEKGSTISLKRAANISGSKISMITILEGPFNKTGEGSIVKIDGNTLTVLDTGKEKSETYSLSPELKLTYKGTALKGISDLKADDVIRYEVRNDLITSIDLVKPAWITVKGILQNIDLNLKTLLIKKPDATLGAFYLAEETAVEIPGLNQPKLEDVFSGDELAVIIDEKQVVQRIQVLNREIRQDIMATMLNFDADNRVLTIRYDNGELKAFYVTEETNLSFEGIKINIESFPTLIAKGRKLLITTTQDKLLDVKSISKFDGVTQLIDTDKKTLTIETAEYRSLTFNYDDSLSVQMKNRALSTFSDLKIGDRVRIQLNAAHDKAASVAVYQTHLYRVADIDVSQKKLSLLEADGLSTELRLTSAVNIIGNDNKSKAFEAIPVEEPIVIHFLGNEAHTVNIASAVRGKVLSLDTANSKISLLSNENIPHDIKVTGDIRVYSGSGQMLQWKDIKQEDRIELVSTNSGQQFITIIPGERKTVFGYNPQTKILTLKRKLLTDPIDFIFHPEAYIHSGSQLLDPAILKEFDKVMIYMLNGKIIELEKIN